MSAPAHLALALVALVAGAVSNAAAQVATQPSAPPSRAVAFPPAFSVMVGVSTYGDRARFDSGPGLSGFAYSLTNGPVAAARLQLPLSRRFGLHVGGAATYRSQRITRDGSPFLVGDTNVLSVRAEGGLLFRFKPAAPMYFGGAVVLQRHSKPPVERQSGGAITEKGGGFGIGYDFWRKPGSGLSGRIELWNFFVGPSRDGLPAGVTPRTRARDLVLTIGVTQRIRLPERRGR